MANFSALARAILPVCAALLLIAGPVAGQEAAPAQYPTLAALDSAIIPPRDRVELSRQLLGVDEIAPPPTSAPLRQVGERAVFNVTNSQEDRSFSVEATLQAVGEHIYLWVEDGAAVDAEQLQALADGFDTRVYDQVRDLWGSENTPGIDGDPRVYGLFAHNLGQTVAAYFVSEHTFPIEAVSTSNEHEMFFFNLDSLGTVLDLPYVESVVAHEFQHMIRNEVQLNEENWLNEGFSEFTQLYLGAPPQSEIYSFLAIPDTQLNLWAEASGERYRNYGAALLFVTYFYDRFGLDALRMLSADDSVHALDGVDNVLQELEQAGVNDFFADWVMANYLFDPNLADGRYGYRSFPAGMVSAVPLGSVGIYPFEVDGEVSQYATDYYILSGVEDEVGLTFELDSPDTVPLVPIEAHSGQHMWYSNRADVSNMTLTRRFDLTGVDNASLHYMVWYHNEQSWDYGYVMASRDDGQTWDVLETSNMTTANPHNVAYGPGYTGASGGWVHETISLEAYAGSEILLRFQVITDDAVTQPGMAIDDLSIPEIGYVQTFEDDGGGWDNEGWIWIDNLLPQSVWIQAAQIGERDTWMSRWRGPWHEPWSLPLEPGTQHVVLAISPFAPVTTVPMPYTLRVTTN